MPRTIESTVGISRRLLNLIVDNRIPGIRSLCCIDLNRQEFFHPLQSTSAIEGGSKSVATTQTLAADAGNPRSKQAEAAASMMEKFRLRNPVFIFKAEGVPYNWKIDCLPVADRKVVCTDQSGRAFLLDYDSRHVATVPKLQTPKWMPISLFVPSAGADADQGSSGRIYFMESIPEPETGCTTVPSDQFEAFFYHRPDEFWQCKSFPPPPFVRDPKYQQIRHKIESYAVVSGGSYICISTGESGTYCLDTANHTWSKIGEWMLPFYGKVEYVPELNLWFGLTRETRHLAAADLSTIFSMDSQPQLVDEWKELDPPVGWIENDNSQLVNLGSGRFCIARYFKGTEAGDDSGDELTGPNMVVLTCVEVKLAHDGNCSGTENGKVKLGITVFKPRCHMCEGIDIETVF